MGKKQKNFRVKARLPRGFVDQGSEDFVSTHTMMMRIREVFELYGFVPLDTPMIEYTDSLGKFLPDQDRPNAGVFSFQDDDEQWLSLRYDLTAPLARYVAENYDGLAKPLRCYRSGYVFRNEKPGPGRFRQFMQFDADTVGTASNASDAEICMMAADCMETLGIPRGDYVIRVNNRKVLDGVIETIELDDDNGEQRLTVLRAIDKLDRLGDDGVQALLGDGRKDESGTYTVGAKLRPEQIERVMAFVKARENEGDVLQNLTEVVGSSEIGQQGVEELRNMANLFLAAGYNEDRILIDPSVVRGLEYYTGPVYEAELLFETVNEKGEKARYGSVAGGGRYDGLVARFKGQQVPATGFSIGVSRLHSALSALGKLDRDINYGPVVVLVMDPDHLTDYQLMTQELRNAGIKSEMYLGTSGMRAQMKYADKRNAIAVVIQGEDERNAGEVQIKDLFEGTRLSADITDNKEWREARPAQFSVSRSDMVSSVQGVIDAYLKDREQET